MHRMRFPTACSLAFFALLLVFIRDCRGLLVSPPSPSRFASSYSTVHQFRSHQVALLTSRRLNTLRIVALQMREDDEDGSSEKIENDGKRKEGTGDKNDDDNDRNKNSYTWEEIQADPELSKLESDSTKKRYDMWFLPGRISRAVTTLAWGFVIVGFSLNLVGYGFVRDESGFGLRIGTMDERNFQREVYGRRTAKEETRAISSLSPTGRAQDSISSWLLSDRDV